MGGVAQNVGTALQIGIASHTCTMVVTRGDDREASSTEL